GTPEASWVGPGGAGYALQPTDGLLVRAAMNDGRADIADAPVVFAGYGISAPERDWDDWGDLDVRGAVVVVLADEPAGPRFNGEFPTLYATLDYKTEEAARRGAVGLLVLADDDDGAWTRRIERNRWPDTLAPGRDHLEFTGRVHARLARRWAAAAGHDLEALRAAAETGGLRAVALEGVRLTVRASETVETV